MFNPFSFGYCLLHNGSNECMYVCMYGTFLYLHTHATKYHDTQLIILKTTDNHAWPLAFLQLFICLSAVRILLRIILSKTTATIFLIVHYKSLSVFCIVFVYHQLWQSTPKSLLQIITLIFQLKVLPSVLKYPIVFAVILWSDNYYKILVYEYVWLILVHFSTKVPSLLYSCNST